MCFLECQARRAIPADGPDVSEVLETRLWAVFALYILVQGMESRPEEGRLDTGPPASSVPPALRGVDLMKASRVLKGLSSGRWVAERSYAHHQLGAPDAPNNARLGCEEHLNVGCRPTWPALHTYVQS